MQIAVAFVHILVLATFSFWFWKRELPSLKIYFWPALLIKIAAGIALGWLYSHYYSVGDTFQYFEDGKKLAALARADVKIYFAFLWSGDESFDVWSTLVLTEPRALFLTKIVSLFSVITLNNYWIISVYFSVISFYGAWFLVKQIIALNQSYTSAAILALLFFPSVVFWSSGLIKESLAMPCLFFLCSFFVKIWIKKKPTLAEWILLMTTLWVLWNLKYYYLAVFLPVVFTSLIVKTFIAPVLNTKKFFTQITIWLTVLIVPVVAISFFHPNFHPEEFLYVIASNNEAFLRLSDPTDAIQYIDLQPSVTSVLINSPWALISGLFRPFIWESDTVFQFLVGLENALILLLTGIAISGSKNVVQSPHRLLVFSIVSYAAILCIFLALSTPNFGTLARYKVGFMPFFLLVILINNPILSRISSFYQRSISNLVR